MPFLAKSSNCGWVSAISAVDKSRISFLKLKLGGGEGMMGAAVHDGWMGKELGFRRCDLRLRELSLMELGAKIENGDGVALMLAIFFMNRRERSFFYREERRISLIEFVLKPLKIMGLLFITLLLRGRHYRLVYHR